MIRLTALEQRAVFGLAAIMGARMSGMFIILPVFTLYASHLPNVTSLQVGLVIGIYGLTQALLQIPFGLLSDYVGRKPVITAGLLIFAAGSIVAAQATTIEGIIVGRALQGAGAIASTIMAMAADLTREEHRTRAMAILGVTIGMSFMASMFLGPLLHRWLEVQQLFWFTAALALLGLLVLHLWVPTPMRTSFHSDAEPALSQFGLILRDTQLLRLNFGVFALHAQLTSLFLVMPVLLRENAGIDPANHGFVYLPILFLAMLAMVPLIIFGEKHHHMKSALIIGISLLLATMAGLMLEYTHAIPLLLLLFLFFLAFNLLEALMPSLISKIAPARAKGTAMGAFSTSQFMGAFFGGTFGGWVHHHYGLAYLFAFGSALTLVWLLLTLTMRDPPHWTTFLLHVENEQQAIALNAALKMQPGVLTVDIILAEKTAYLKVDPNTVDWEALQNLQG